MLGGIECGTNLFFVRSKSTRCSELLEGCMHVPIPEQHLALVEQSVGDIRARMH